MNAYDTALSTTVRRYPIRGAIWGMLLGLGLALYSVLLSQIAFGDWVPLIVIVALATVLGTLWGKFGPVRANPRGKPPADPPPLTQDDDWSPLTANVQAVPTDRNPPEAGAFVEALRAKETMIEEPPPS